MTTSPFTPTPRLLAAAPLFASLLLLGKTPATAATIQWTGTDSALWQSNSNWSEGAAPTLADDVVFGSLVPVSGEAITLGAGSLAGSLWIGNNFSFLGGDLEIGSGVVTVARAYTLELESKLSGTEGLTLLGGGALRLRNSLNDYTGITTIANGTLIISNASQLGLDTSAVVVTGSQTRGFGGGSLVLDGYTSGINFTRDLQLQGRGPITDRSAAVVSLGSNTLSGTVSTGLFLDGTAQNTTFGASNGVLALSGALNVGGTAVTTFTTFGLVNTVGASFYEISGTLAGTGSIEKTGAGTLFFNPTDSSNFSGTIRASAGSIRVTTPSILGVNTGTNASSAIDLNAGVFEFRMDAPVVGRNVYFRSTSTSTAANILFMDHAPGSDAVNAAATFGTLRFNSATTAPVYSFNSRNGFGASFGAASVEGTGNTTLTNNLGGLLTIGGNLWSINTTTARTLLVQGNGNTVVTGSLLAAGADHVFTKTGSGRLELRGVAATILGGINVNGGQLAITDFRSVNNNHATATGMINIGTGTTAGILTIGTPAAATAAGLTTSRVINLAGTTGAATINASQSVPLPVVINSNISATGGSASNAKTLTLTGSSKADNIINGVIPNNDAGGTVNLAKAGSGTWVLAGANTYTGATSLFNGILRLQANGEMSSVIADTSGIVFNASNVMAGAALEFAGQTGVNNFEQLGSLTPTAGSNTIRLIPGLGGSASLDFASLGTVNAAATVNFVTPGGSSVFTFGTLAASGNMVSAGLYFNGADFAYNDGGTLRAPQYGMDGDFAVAAEALTASQSNLVTASFTETASLTIDSLKIAGSHTLVLDTALTIRTAGASNATGGILQTGGSGVINGAGVRTGGSGALVMRVDGVSDTLTLNAPIVATSTGGFTKSGAGTLVIGGVNLQTGTNTINEGVVRMADGGKLSANNATLNIRQGAVLDLNGVDIGTSIGAFNSNGTVTNSSASDVTLRIGNGITTNGTAGTSYGVIEDGTGGGRTAVTVSTSNNNAAQTTTFLLYGNSTYTGPTTITKSTAGNLLLQVYTLGDIGQDSGIGRGNAGDNAGSLVFGGNGGTLVYVGTVVDPDTILTAGSVSASTNRLFTIAGSGATLSSVASNNNSVVWSNYGDIEFGGVVGPKSLTLTGTSTADNRLNPRITDSGSGADITSVTKTGTGVWVLGNPNNTYSGITSVSNGILAALDGASLPTASNLVLDGGTFMSSGVFDRALGAGADEFRFSTPAANTARFAGFAGGDEKLTVQLSGNPVWGSTAHFIDGRNGLIFGAMQGTTAVALSEVEMAGDFSLGTADNAGKSITVTTTNSSATITVTTGDTSGLAIGQTVTGAGIPSGAYIVAINSATSFVISASVGSSAGATGVALTAEANAMRTIRVDSNTNTQADFATLTGVISGDAGTGIRKTGAGTLRLFGASTYSGETSVYQGILTVNSLGDSSAPGLATSVGLSTGANLAANAVTLGNTGTGAGILQYSGPGETSDRMIRLNSTTGTNQIHADGAGPLILTNVVNDMAAGNKTLALRGSNTQGNMITSPLSDNGGTLGVTVDGSAVWILTNGANDFTGNVTVSAGALGIGHDQALGFGTGNLILNSGSIFAYGGDRVVANPVQQSNNTTTAFIGEHSLTFTGDFQSLAAANNWGTTNALPEGKTLTFGNVTANSITAARTWTFNGSGDTVINGNITTSTGFNVNLTYSGTGSLTLGGSANALNAGTVTISNGTVKIGADNALNSATTGNLVMNPAVGITATLDVFGSTDMVRGITANSLGTAVINNSSASAASLAFGNGDQAVTFIGNIMNSGVGALSLIKTGSAIAAFTGGTYGHAGATIVQGGTMTLGGNVSATSSVSVTGAGSFLGFTGGFSGSAGLASLTVDAGATFSLLDGLGSAMPNLTHLSLGASGAGTVTLNLNVGTEATDTITITAGGTLLLGNTVTFNMSDAGLEENTPYTLLSAPGGGLLATLGAGDFIQGGTPGGFTGYTWEVTDTHVRLITGDLILGSLYWTGASDNTWNGSVSNWSTDKSGSPAAVSIPGAGTDVVFAADTVAGGALVTTLEQNFRVNSLTFEAGTSTPSSVTIQPGADSSNRIEIKPQDSTDGIAITAGGPASVTLGASVKVGADQTWHVANASSVLNLSAALLGDGAVTKTGDGKVVVSASADPTFAVPSVTVNGGAFEITSSSALGSTIGGNASQVIIGAGGTFYYNGATATLNNSLNLAGGTLASAGGNSTYNAPVTVSANSVVLLQDPLASAVARTIALSNQLTGSGKLTVDSTATVSSGNQISGILTLNNDNSGWSGGLDILRGDVRTNNINGFGTGDITFSRGKAAWQGINNATWIIPNNITIGSGGGYAMGEINVDNVSAAVSQLFTANFTGLVTLGGAGGAGEMRVFLADAANTTANFLGGVLLANDGVINVRDNATLARATVDSIISESGGARSLSVNVLAASGTSWGGTAGVLVLNGANTFTGNLILGAGSLEFSTVSDAGGAASNLGQGGGITLGTANLRFIGDASQSTNRPINTTGSPTLTANGASGAVITYAGAITQTTNNALTLGGTGEGRLTGGLTQLGTTADLTVTSGVWTVREGAVSLADDLLVNGGTLNLEDMVFTLNDDTIASNPGTVLNLNSTGVLAAANPAGTSTGLYSRNGALINLNANDVFGAENSGGLDFIMVGDATAGAAATLNTHTFNLSSPRMDVGGILAGLEGVVAGSGTLTITYAGTDYAQGIRLFRGSVSANLAGQATILKTGGGEVVLSGDNSGLQSTIAATRVDAGRLVLDYTAQNNNKISDSAGLDMRGGSLLLVGNDSADTSQSVTSLVLNIGSSDITLQHGEGRTVTLSLGEITRAAGATVNFGFAPGSGIIQTTSVNGSGAILGGHATVRGTGFATVVGGQIAVFDSTILDDIITWAGGEDVTDSSGFTGIISGGGIRTDLNSLRFGASGALSTVNLGDVSNFLHIASGGILVSSEVGAGSASLVGGSLLGAGGTGTELFVHQHNTQSVFEIGSRLAGLSVITKAGAGALLLNGSNTRRGDTNLNEGTLLLGGGGGVGPYSRVVLKNLENVVLDINNGVEVVGGLSGGGTVGGLVRIGSGTLVSNTSPASQVYIGVLEGNGTFIKAGVNTQELEGDSLGFTGHVIVNGGLLHLDTTNGRINLAASITLNGAEVLTDQDQTSSQNRIGDNTVVTLNNTAGTRGLWLRNENQDANRADVIGSVVLGAGHNTIQSTTNAGASTSRIATMTISSLSRENFATALVRGQALGSGANNRGRITLPAMPAEAVGGGGAAGTTTITIIPYLIGQAGVSNTLTDANLALLTGNSFVTWVSAAEGLRPLDLNSEYILNEAGYNALAASSASNVRFAANPGAALGGGSKTVNSLVLDSSAEALTVNGPGGGSLTLASGALLAATTTPANGISLGGFDELLTSTSEYIVHVTNAAGTLSIGSALNSQASLTKTGNGILALGSLTSGYDGGTWINQGLIEISDLAALGSGDVHFFGGGLRWAEGATFDPSARGLNFNLGGAIFDTNGNDVAIASSIGGTGLGGLVKTGAGNLTLNATVVFQGSVTVNAGTLTYGAGSVLPSTTNLVLGGGVFDHAEFDTTLGGLLLNVNSTINGAAPLTFTGNVEFHGSGSRTLTIHNTGLTTFDGALFTIVDRAGTARTAAIAGSGNTVINSQIIDGTAAGALNITNTGTTTITGRNTYTGTTTVNPGAAGTVVITNNQAFGIGAALTLASGTLRGDGSGVKVISQNVTNSTGTIIIGGEDGFVFNGSWLTSGGTRTLQADTTGGVVINGIVTLGETTNNRTQIFSGGGDIVVNGVIQANSGAATPTGAITYTGNGTLTLGAVNTYLGTTTVNSTLGTGRMIVLEDAALPGGAASTGVPLVVRSGTLELQNGLQHITTLAMGNGTPEGSVGVIDIGGGGLALNGTVTYTASETSGTNHIQNGTVYLQANRTFTVNDSTATELELVVSAQIQNNVTGTTARNLTKGGAGTMLLTAANTYTGTTTVSAGTLLAGNTSGSATGTGAVTVAAGATLGGNGIIAPGNNTSITINGTLQVGAAGDESARQLTLNTTGTGLVTINDIVIFDLFSGQGSGGLNDASHNDSLVIGGTNGLTLGAGAQLHVTASMPVDETWMAGTEWRLFDWTGLTGGVTGAFSNLSDPAPFNYMNLPDLSSIGLAWDVSNLYTQGTIMVVVPEPGRVLLLFLGLMGLHFRRRR